MTAPKKPQQQLPVQSTPASPMIEDTEPEALPELDVTDAEALRERLLTDVRAEGKRISDVMQESRDAIAEVKATHEARMGRWKVEADKARGEYRVEPLAPEVPDTRQEHALFLRMQDLQGENVRREQKVLGWSRMPAETAWQNARREFAVQAAEHIEALESLLGQVSDWHRLVLDCRRADEQSKGGFVRQGDSERTKSHMEILDVIELGRGVDVLEPAPRPPSKVKKIPHGEDAAEIAAAAEHARQVERRNALGVRQW